MYAFCSDMYCSTMWYNGTVTAMKRMRIAYDNRLRRLLGIPKHNSASEMFVQLNIKSFAELMRTDIYSFTNKLQCSKYVILTAICKNTVPSNIWTWWYDMCQYCELHILLVFIIL